MNIDLLSFLYQELQLSKTQTIQQKSGIKYFTEEETQRIYKHMEKYSTHLGMKDIPKEIKCNSPPYYFESLEEKFIHS